VGDSFHVIVKSLPALNSSPFAPLQAVLVLSLVADQFRLAAVLAIWETRKPPEGQEEEGRDGV
jgi:hypothetical protein